MLEREDGLKHARDPTLGRGIFHLTISFARDRQFRELAGKHGVRVGDVIGAALAAEYEHGGLFVLFDFLTGLNH